MHLVKAIAGLLIGAALVAPSALARSAEQGLPRAMPADYAKYLAPTQAVSPGTGFAWTAAAIGAGVALALVALGVALVSRRRLRSRKAFVFGAGVLGIAAVAVPVAFAASNVLRDTNSVRLRVIASDFPDGFESTWHTHPGPVFVQVQEGKFKIYQGSCQPTVVSAGETYMEVPFVPVKAVATGPIRWTTSQVIPQADAPQTDVASPCD